MLFNFCFEFILYLRCVQTVRPRPIPILIKIAYVIVWRCLYCTETEAYPPTNLMGTVPILLVMVSVSVSVNVRTVTLTR